MRKPMVFVVDDEEQICDLLTRILERDGCEVRSFQDPRDAVEAAETEAPDVILTDLMMPGLSGLELIQRIRERRPDVGAVLMTGYASIENVVDALRSDVDDFVPKPFSVTEIRNVVTRVLQTREEAARQSRYEPPPQTIEPLEESMDVTPSVAGEDEKDTGSSDNQLARKFRDMSVTEQIHGLLARDLPLHRLVPGAANTLAGALSITHAVLLVPGDEYGTFRVISSTVPGGAWTAGRAVPLPELTLVAASGMAARLGRDGLGVLSGLLDEGPLAAAPICPRSPSRADAGILIGSRPRGDPDFHEDALRLLSVAASALGDVHRALQAPARAETAYVRSLTGVVGSTEFRTPWFRNHSDRVHGLAMRLARRVGLAAEELDVLDVASRLLDLGRVAMPDSLLMKAEAPTADEWNRLRMHVQVADDLIEPVGVLRDVKPVVRHHHENFDGSGYPDGLRGEEIPFLAALVRVIDTYAALTSDRAWRKGMDPGAAMREIVQNSGTQFHPELVAAFTQMQMEGDVDGPGRDTRTS